MASLYYTFSAMSDYREWQKWPIALFVLLNGHPTPESIKLYDYFNVCSNYRNICFTVGLRRLMAIGKITNGRAKEIFEIIEAMTPVFKETFRLFYKNSEKLSKTGEYEFRGQYSSFIQQQFHHLKNTAQLAYVVTHNNLLPALSASSVFNPDGYKKYLGEEDGLDMLVGFKDSEIKLLPIQANSCYCDVLFTYMFGFTDLFDHGFKRGLPGIGQLDVECDPKEDTAWTIFRSDDEAKKATITRFSNEGSDFDDVIFGVNMMSGTWGYSTESVQDLLAICNHVRGKTNKDIEIHRVAIRDRIASSSQFTVTGEDYFEYYIKILGQFGLSYTCIPKVAVTVSISTSDQTYRLMEFCILSNNSELIRHYQSRLNSSVNAFRPDVFFNYPTTFSSVQGLFDALDMTNLPTGLKRYDPWKMYAPMVTHDRFFHGSDTVSSIEVEFKLLSLPNIFFCQVGDLSYNKTEGKSNPFSTIVDAEQMWKLNIPVTLNSIEGQDEYYITGIVLYRKDTDGGHYMLFARNPGNGTWFFYNDTIRYGILEKKKYTFDLEKSIERRSEEVRKIYRLIMDLSYGVWYTRKSIFEAY